MKAWLDKDYLESAISYGHMVNLYMRLGSFLGGASVAPPLRPHGSLNISEPMSVRIKI